MLQSGIFVCARIELGSMAAPTTKDMHARANVKHAVGGTLNHVDAAYARLLDRVSALVAAIGVATFIALFDLKGIAARLARCRCKWRSMSSIVARSATKTTGGLAWVFGELFAAMGACGSIHVVDSSFQLIGHATGCYKHRGGNSIGCYSFILAHVSGEINGEMVSA